MTIATYLPPVDQLLTLGEPQEFSIEKWINYPEQFGFTLDHVPDLLRLVARWTEEVADQEVDDDAVIYAPIHAWRAIGQLRAETAIDPLMALLPLTNDIYDEWVSEELPQVLGLIGPPVIPALTAYLAAPNQQIWSKGAAARAFVCLVKHDPDQRSEAISVLTTTLAAFADHAPELNGLLVCYLLDLKAIEAAPTMEQAFAANAVDLAFAGDWDAVQVTLGLKTREEVPRRSLVYLEGRSADRRPEPLIQGLGGSNKAGGKAKARAKNKMAKQSRKKNRKRGK